MVKRDADGWLVSHRNVWFPLGPTTLDGVEDVVKLVQNPMKGVPLIVIIVPVPRTSNPPASTTALTLQPHRLFHPSPMTPSLVMMWLLHRLTLGPLFIIRRS